MVPAIGEDEGPHETTGRGKYPRRRSGVSDWDGDEVDEDPVAEETVAGTGIRGYSRKTGYPPMDEASYAARERDARVRRAPLLYIALTMECNMHDTSLGLSMNLSTNARSRDAPFVVMC